MYLISCLLLCVFVVSLESWKDLERKQPGGVIGSTIDFGSISSGSSPDRVMGELKCGSYGVKP